MNGPGMKTYLAIFLIAAFAAAVLTPLLRRWCERRGLVDRHLGNRRIHETAVPRLGGIAIFASVVLALLSLTLLHNALVQNLRPELKSIVSVLVCGLLVLALGVYDDVRGANATVKLIGLIGITVLFYALGGRIEGLSIPFVGQVVIHPLIGFACTLVWVVGITNAFNLIDGVDGLAAGSALFSTLVLLTNSLIQGQTRVTIVTLALSGALAGFLRYNFNPASIFLGDSGSLLVGFLLAALSVQGSQKASTAVAVAIPMFAFGLPVVDTAVTIGRRLLSGKPVFEGDREHIHHMLLARGWSQRRVALALYVVSAGFGLAAMLFVNTGSAVPAIVLFVIGVAIILALGNLRYHEVDELRASVRRNISDRRLRAINNLRIRRACQSLSSARRLNDLFKAVVEVLEAGDFVTAEAELSCNGHVLVNARALELAEGNDSTDQLKLWEGHLQWTWQRSPASASTEFASELWTIRLPISSGNFTLGYLSLSRPLLSEPLLFDVNYLTRVFQPAIANAAQRIFDEAEESMPRQRAANAG
jgi:UDP-GlcNAc:undecaprenyl-phosphate GlcNAc-1-phosphate transferase